MECQMLIIIHIQIPVLMGLTALLLTAGNAEGAGGVSVGDVSKNADGRWLQKEGWEEMVDLYRGGESRQYVPGNDDKTHDPESQDFVNIVQNGIIDTKRSIKTDQFHDLNINQHQVTNNRHGSTVTDHSRHPDPGQGNHKTDVNTRVSYTQVPGEWKSTPVNPMLNDRPANTAKQLAQETGMDSSGNGAKYFVFEEENHKLEDSSLPQTNIDITLQNSHRPWARRAAGDWNIWRNLIHESPSATNNQPLQLNRHVYSSGNKGNGESNFKIEEHPWATNQHSGFIYPKAKSLALSNRHQRQSRTKSSSAVNAVRHSRVDSGSLGDLDPINTVQITNSHTDNLDSPSSLSETIPHSHKPAKENSNPNGKHFSNSTMNKEVPSSLADTVSDAEAIELNSGAVERDLAVSMGITKGNSYQIESHQITDINPDKGYSGPKVQTVTDIRRSTDLISDIPPGDAGTLSNGFAPSDTVNAFPAASNSAELMGRPAGQRVLKDYQVLHSLAENDVQEVLHSLKENNYVPEVIDNGHRPPSIVMAPRETRNGISVHGQSWESVGKEMSSQRRNMASQLIYRHSAHRGVEHFNQNTRLLESVGDREHPVQRATSTEFNGASVLVDPHITGKNKESKGAVKGSSLSARRRQKATGNTAENITESSGLFSSGDSVLARVSGESRVEQTNTDRMNRVVSSQSTENSSINRSNLASQNWPDSDIKSSSNVTIESSSNTDIKSSSDVTVAKSSLHGISDIDVQNSSNAATGISPNKANTVPSSSKHNQAAQLTNPNEKHKNMHRRFHHSGNQGIGLLLIPEPHNSIEPNGPDLNPNDNAPIHQQQSHTGQEKRNTANVADWDKTAIEPAPLMVIDSPNGHKVPIYFPHRATDSESSSQIDPNVQLPHDVILDYKSRKAVRESISIDLVNSQVSLRHNSISDRPHNVYDHVQLSEGFRQEIFPEQLRSSPIKDLRHGLYVNHHRVQQIQDHIHNVLPNFQRTSQKDHLPVRLKRDTVNKDFLSSLTHSSDSLSGRRKKSGDTVRSNLFHWSTTSSAPMSHISTKSGSSDHEQNTNRVTSRAQSGLESNAFVQNTNLLSSLDPDDGNSKSNQHQSIIRHLRHKLEKHPHLHRKSWVGMGRTKAHRNIHNDVLNADVYTNYQIHNGRVSHRGDPAAENYVKHVRKRGEVGPGRIIDNQQSVRRPVDSTNYQQNTTPQEKAGYENSKESTFPDEAIEGVDSVHGLRPIAVADAFLHVDAEQLDESSQHEAGATHSLIRDRSHVDSQLQTNNVKSIRKRSEGSELNTERTQGKPQGLPDVDEGLPVDPAGEAEGLPVGDGEVRGSRDGEDLKKTGALGDGTELEDPPEYEFPTSEQLIEKSTEQTPADPINDSSSPGGTDSHTDGDSSDNPTLPGLSYRAPAFIAGGVHRPVGAYRPAAPVAHNHVLDEDDNNTSTTGAPGAVSDNTGQLNNDTTFTDPLQANKTEQITDNTDNTDNTHNTDNDKTGLDESVIQLDLIQDPSGESIKPEAAEQELGNSQQEQGISQEEGDPLPESPNTEAENGDDESLTGEEAEPEVEAEVQESPGGSGSEEPGAMNPTAEGDAASEEPGYEYPEPEGEYPEPEGEFPEPEGEYPEPEGEFPEPEGEYPEPEGEFPEPEGEFPEPEGEFPEPEGSGGTENENLYAEPEPNWGKAKDIWGPAWEVHIYIAGIGFALLAVYSIVSMLRLYRHKNLLSLAYFLALNAVMAFMGVTRAVYYLVDAYNTRGTFHPVVYYFLYSIGFPCLTSAFSILFMALLRTTRMQLLSPRIQKTSVLVAIITTHFLISITTDFVVGYFSSAAILLFVCQLATVLWGLFLFGAYLYIFKKLYRNAKWRQREMTRYQLSHLKLEGVTPITKTPKLTLNVAIRVTMVTALFGLLYAGIMTYSLVGVYSVFSHTTPEPWPWWIFKFCTRLVELAMCITMSYVATQPFRYNSDVSSTKWSFSRIMFYFPCRRLCMCDELELRDEGLHWMDNQLYTQTDPDQLVPSDGNSFNINPVLVEESIPITLRTQSIPSKGTTGTSMSDTSTSNTESGNTQHPQHGATRPNSLLVKENGLVRFRQEGDEDADPVVLSTEDELDDGDPEVLSNPFAAALAQHHRNFLLQEENQPERKSRLEMLLAGQGIILPDQFGESSTDPYHAKRHSFKSSFNRNKRPKYNRTKSAPGGCDTPASTRSFCSDATFLDGNASMWSYRPPSSIHLRDSIENYLDMSLDTPDILDSPGQTPSHLRGNYLHSPGRGLRSPGHLTRTKQSRHKSGGKSGSFSRVPTNNPGNHGNRYFSSTSDLQSLHECHDNIDFQLHQQQPLQHNSQDSMTFSTLSDLSLEGVTRSPRRLPRSSSDSGTGCGIPRDLSFPSGYESADSDRGAPGKDHWKHMFDKKRKVQNLLNDINDLCTENSD